jgi:3-hydroxyacyl-CoA dehydrogenase
VIQQIHRAAVLGSGVMGSGIAAHLANIGIPTLLLDIVPKELTEAEKAKGLTLHDQEVRNRLATGSLQKLSKQKPAPLISKKSLELIETGNLEDDLIKLKEADWIIEAVTENLAVKQQVLAEVDQHRKSGSIVSSNTSGISIEKMAKGRSEDFQKHFLGTHFFNPPRYMKLLEIIPAKNTNPDVMSFMEKFSRDKLGKGVVVAKDTPNFIANRIGTYGLLVTVQEMLKGGYSVGEIDSITGTVIGRPKSATFRTMDVVGLDTFIHVINTVYEQAEGKEKEAFETPDFMKEMLQKGWLGSKTNQGFYLKKGKGILELDPKTLTYGPVKKLKTTATEQSKQEKRLADKLKVLIYSNDRAGTLLWNILSPVLIYTAELLGKIAEDIVSIDRAMKWGFGWELGPFEIWDAIGLEKSFAKMETEGKDVPSWVKEMLVKGFTSFYHEQNGTQLFYHNGEYRLIEENPKSINLTEMKKQENRVLKKNSGASLIDLGDGVLALEFHSLNQSIGPDIIQMINFSVAEVEGNHKGLVIGNQGKSFCVGANLAMILMEAEDDNIFELESIVHSFQQAMMKLKFCKKPVVAAPFGMTLGGGAEICLHTARIQASTETYMGLVETGVGLIPGGGGTKELYIKHLNAFPAGVDNDLLKIAGSVFEKIALAKVSTSAEEAREYFFLSKFDRISANQDHLLFEAKQTVLDLSHKGYRPPARKKVPVVGETGYAALLLSAQSLLYAGYISEHDFKIAKKLAFVIAGGKVPYGIEVDEQYLLNLEREAFLSLVSDPKSQQRMQNMLVKGKPLRN